MSVSLESTTSNPSTPSSRDASISSDSSYSSRDSSLDEPSNLNILTISGRALSFPAYPAPDTLHREGWTHVQYQGQSYLIEISEVARRFYMTCEKVEEICRQGRFLSLFGTKKSLAFEEAVRSSKGVFHCLEEDEIQALTNYIFDNYVQLSEEARKFKEDYVYLSASSYGLPRSLEVHADGRIYIHFTKTRLKLQRSLKSQKRHLRVTEKDKLLGKGSFRKFRTACDFRTGQFLAVGSMEVTYKNIDLLDAEVAIFRSLNDCENVIKLLGTVEGSGKGGRRKFFLKHPIYEAGNLRKLKEELSPTKMLILVMQLLTGLNEMHRRGIVHRDIKDANVLIDQEGNAYIADFNLSCTIDDAYALGQLGGTIPLLSPELSQAFLENTPTNEYSGQSNDVWAMGCLFYEQYYKRPLPWRFQAPAQMKSKDIQKNQLLATAALLSAPASELEEMDPLESCEANPVAHLICEMLNPDQSKRITSSEAFEKYMPLLQAKVQDA